MGLNTNYGGGADEIRRTGKLHSSEDELHEQLSEFHETVSELAVRSGLIARPESGKVPPPEQKNAERKNIPHSNRYEEPPHLSEKDVKKLVSKAVANIASNEGTATAGQALLKKIGGESDLGKILQYVKSSSLPESQKATLQSLINKGISLGEQCSIANQSPEASTAVLTAMGDHYITASESSAAEKINAAGLSITSSLAALDQNSAQIEGALTAFAGRVMETLTGGTPSLTAEQQTIADTGSEVMNMLSIAGKGSEESQQVMTGMAEHYMGVGETRSAEGSQAAIATEGAAISSNLSILDQSAGNSEAVLNAFANNIMETIMGERSPLTVEQQSIENTGSEVMSMIALTQQSAESTQSVIEEVANRLSS